MALINHNISIANDGLGDQLRTAFSNQNLMNSELYTETGKLRTDLIAAATGASGKSITPTSPAPTGTGIQSFIATQAGFYPNHGNVEVLANSFALISKDAAGVFSISQTPLDISSKVNVLDIVNNLTSSENAKPGSANNDRLLNEKILSNTNSLTNKADLLVGKNLFNYNDSEVLRGFYLNSLAVPVANSAYSVSGFIPILPTQTVICNKNEGGGSSNCFYDSNKIFISGSGTNTALKTAPANAYFIRYSLNLPSANNILTENIQVEIGSVSTVYEAYKMTVKSTQLPMSDYTKTVDLENAISPFVSKKVDLLVGKNKYNKLVGIDGFYVKTTDGTLLANATWSTSEFIKIESSTSYFFNSYSNFSAWYDANKVFISGFQPINTAATSPSNAKYVRTSVSLLANKELLQIELGSVATAYESYKLFADSSQIILTDYVKNTNVLDLIKDKVDLLVGKNKYNKLVGIDGFYVKTTDGTLLANATWSTSEFIKIESSTSYFFNSYANWSAWYDANKVFISGFQPINTAATSPSNAKYVRTSVSLLANKELLQIELGTVATTYEPYTTSLNSSQINTLPIYGIWRNKIGLALGDSVTASLRYQPYVREKLALKEYRTKALGGADILTIIDGNGGSYLPLTSAELVDVDFVTFFGGINNRSQLVGNITDVYPTQDTVMGRYRYVINKLYSLANEVGRKNIRIIFIAPHKVGKYGYVNYTGGEEYPVGSGQTLETIVNKLKELCGLYAIPVADLYHNSGISEFTWDIYTMNNVTSGSTYPTLPDNVHLNLLGSEMISRVIASVIKKS